MIIRSPQKKNISFTLPVSNFEVKNRSLISTHNLSSLELLKNVLKSCVRSGNIRLNHYQCGKHGGKENHSVRECERVEIF